jgi:hypothetical protein
MLGARYTLDLSQDDKRNALVKLIKQHRQGFGEFNAVTLDGAAFSIPGTKQTSAGGSTSEHFDNMGKGAGRSAKGEMPKPQGVVGGIDLKKSLQSAVDYKGLEYSEAELAKLPKAEAEYRRELMRRSKQEIKMEMGFETALKGGIEMYQKLMGRSKGAEGGDKISDVPEYVAKIPVPPRPRGLRVARAATCCCHQSRACALAFGGSAGWQRLHEWPLSCARRASWA